MAGYYLNPGSDQSAKLCQITTPKGSKAYVELADGTKVWLNAESSLKYPENFDSEGRNVYLEGEGYFEVAKDKNRPFIVHTSQIDIKALGTVFNVKSYTSEDIIQTTLVEGSVVIEKRNLNRSENTSASAGKSATYMKPNQQVTFYKTTSVIDITSKTSVIKSSDQYVVSKSEKIVKKDSLLIDKKVDIKLFTAWKDNRLVFDNEPFESLSVKLERRFNMKFSFMDDEIRSFRFTGQFNEISMEQLLEALQFASPFHYVINKSEVFIGLKPLQLKNNE
ncbi:MAG: FecR family protein [Bacteroidetes bacterium]|nr:FecR family protein [Bacteroidota bacterium]